MADGNPPKILPALVLKKTGKTIIIDGVERELVSLERDTNFEVNKKPNYNDIQRYDSD